MEEQFVNLLACGSADWPRFLIFHGERNLFWNKGRWRSSWRNGELWNDSMIADHELEHARTFAKQFESGDE